MPISRPDERPRVARMRRRLPVRALIGAVAATPIAFLFVTLILLVAGLAVPHRVMTALDAMKGTGGTLTMSTELAGDIVHVDIADTGTGIRPDLLGRIFEPFFTTKPEGEGTGLGLSISSWVVQRAGGHISVESTPGRGATFRVTLRAARPRAACGGTDADRSVACR